MNRQISSFLTNPVILVLVAIILLLPAVSQAQLKAAASSATSITLTWTAPGDDGAFGTANQYDIRYSTSTINDANWDAATQAIGEPTPQAAGNTESFMIANLNPSTTYFFAIKVADEVPNWSVLSNVISRTTDPEDIAPAIIADVSVSTVTSNSISLNWTASGDDGTTGTASQYDIRYSTSPITTLNWDAATQVIGEPTPQAAGATESITISSLNSNTQYFFAVNVADEVPNWSGLSNVASGTTNNEQVVPGTITNLVAINPTDSSIYLAWLAPGDDGSVGTASQYDIRMSTSLITDANFNSATPISSVPAPQVAGTPETLLVTGLTQEVTYYFAIKTADEVPNWSALSNVVSNTTVDITPPAGINDLQTSTGSESGAIILNWTAPGDDGMIGSASLYEIRYAETRFNDSTFSSASMFLAPPPPLTAGTEQTVSITGLTPGAMYYVAMRAFDDKGNISEISNLDSAEAYINISTDINDDNNLNLPESFALGQNFPNPFNPTTSINFSIPQNSYVELHVYSIDGRRIATLAEGEYSAGEHSIEWDGTTLSGQAAATGVYLYRLASESYVETKKMMLLK